MADLPDTVRDEVSIRPAVTDDIPAMANLERDAGALFRTVGLDEVASDELPDAGDLQPHIDAGTAWIAEVEGMPAGYIVASVVDDEGHVDQVSVLPDFRGMRIGRRLIDTVEAWARTKGLQALTLTTFVDVPWNGPYYSRLGFEPVPLFEMGPQLERIRSTEIERGLDAMQPRIAMRRRIGLGDQVGQVAAG